MNDVTSKIAVFLLIPFSQAAVLTSSPAASSGCVRLTIASDGMAVVQFTLPHKLATPPWDMDALAEHGFSLEKHGPLPYFPVRPVVLEIGSNAVSVEFLKSKVVEVPDVIRQASETPQPAIESDILLAPRSGRSIPITAFPESSFPTQHVVADKPVTFGDRTIVRVKIYPFACEKEGSPPTRADLLVFRIIPLHSGLAKETAAKPARSLPAAKTGASRPLIISVASDGIYAVHAEDLLPWWGGVRLSSLGLTWRGQEVPYHAIGDGDELLEAGESILFYGLGGDNIFTPENAYWVSDNGNAVQMEWRSQPPPGEGAVTKLPCQVRFEQNHVRYETQPPGTGDDPWFWMKITAPGKAEIQMELGNLADSPDFRAEVRVRVQGASSYHATRVSINGNSLLEEQWEGLVPNVVQAEFSQHLLQEGTNVVTIEEFNEGAQPDILYLDWIEVRYDSRLVLSDDQLTVTVPANTPGIIVSGLVEPDVLVFDVTQEQSPHFIRGFRTTAANGAYRLNLGTMSDSEREYTILSGGSAKRHSSIWRRSESTLSNAENGADWIVIAHPNFLDAATRLASHRESQGLRTAVVDVQDVYDEFNYGITSPEAVREFVKFAYQNWQAPAPRYLVLFGDGHADYMDWFET
ncbi:hypothetical protein HQ563_18400, partial [bacterium]|nr:hypothetical protein [bacterium]